MQLADHIFEEFFATGKSLKENHSIYNAMVFRVGLKSPFLLKYGKLINIVL